jgi:hypothetical protein
MSALGLRPSPRNLWGNVEHEHKLERKMLMKLTS